MKSSNDVGVRLLHQFPGRDRWPRRDKHGANFTPFRRGWPNRKIPISSDNRHLFSNLRGHEEISESSGKRHCPSGWVTAIWPPSKAWAASMGGSQRRSKSHLGDLL